ncbi:MAG TPA: discoidin domain-containing protein, partial [Thermoanaerobaculia bacterium]|nr:discoidin domain-containing protein [Thermoanaerobaculia bacterium]
KKRQVAFAWGPAHGGEIRDLGFVEITVTAGQGGRGSVEIDELTLEELPLEEGPLPAPRAWKSDPAGGEKQQLVIDLGGRRELGGLALDWDAADFARVYDVEMSDDGKAWATARSVAATRGGRAWIPLPESEAAFVRLKLEKSARGRGYVLARVAVEPPEFSETPTKFLESVAAATPRGRWPRSLLKEQLYWTLVGVDGGREKGLLSEDGALETGRGAFAVEPFLVSGGKFYGWAESDTSQSLEDGDLPLPSVLRNHANGLSLAVSAFADGPADASLMRVRYRVRNAGPAAVQATLYLAARPLQVNPPWQFLNVPGGFAPIRSIAWDGRIVAVNGQPKLVPLTPPTSFGATLFEDGEIGSRIAEGSLPTASSAADPAGFASGALGWGLEIPAGGSRDVVIAVPLSAGSSLPEPPLEASADFDARAALTAKSWREKLERVSFDLPAAAQPIARTARANLAWILVNRDGPAIQPGTRSYARSWIRDGALTAYALLRLGHADEVRQFLLWFAPYEFESGAVPCCVDRRGADPVPENDSHGELLFLAGEYYRFTADKATIEAVWPFLAKDAAYIERIRQSRRTEEYRTGPKAVFFGLLPESISHEGYSDHPVHSYWDDFWGIRGLSDAAELAAALGKPADAARFAASRDEMRRDVHASIRAVIAARGLAYIPGSADLGDLDPTSTTIALEPCGEGSRLPQRELVQTFEDYWQRFVARRADRAKGGEYTPYEWRIAGSLVRLGHRDRSSALFEFFFADRRPAAWSHWAEVVWPDLRTPKFIGDMPHGWVASDFIRSFLDLFAYDREEDGALVLGAGIPASWLAEPRGASVSRLRTRSGILDLAFSAEAGGLRVHIGGAAAAPPGGFVVTWPFPGRPSSATVNGAPAPLSAAGEVVVRSSPADVLVK